MSRAPARTHAGRTWFTRVGHEQVRAELLDLVEVVLHFDDGSGGGGVRCNDHVAFSRQCKRGLHGRGCVERCERTRSRLSGDARRHGWFSCLFIYLFYQLG